MMESEVLTLKEFISDYHQRFRRCFPRGQTHEWAQRYVEGLLMEVERNNCWQMAQALKLPPSRLRALQYFLSTSSWKSQDIITELRNFVDEFLGDDEGIFIIDESSVRKWGKKSVGIARQYLGCIGKTDNGQVTVYLSYANRGVRTYLDFRLYVPEEWFENPVRCRQAGIPPGVVFRTKPELAREMVDSALDADFRGKWITADELYGANKALLDSLNTMGLWYVVEVPVTTMVWPSRPQPKRRRRTTRSKTGQKCQIRAVFGGYRQVQQLAKSVKKKDWEILHISNGTKGPLEFEFAFRRVVEKRGDLPGRDAWLMFRRDLSQEPEIKYYLSNAPAEVSPAELATVGSSRWNVEACIKEGKGQSRLDEYECRCWNSFHHHTVLAILAQAFLTRLSLEAKKKSSA